VYPPKNSGEFCINQYRLAANFTKKGYFLLEYRKPQHRSIRSPHIIMLGLDCQPNLPPKTPVMKPILLLSAILLSVLTSLNAQIDSSALSSTPLKKHIPSSAVVRLGSGLVSKGWLYQVNDSQLVVLHAKKSRLRKLSEADYAVKEHTSIMAVDQIKSISVRRKNAGLKGALLGLAAGVLTGVIAGYVEGDDPIMQYNGSDPFGALLVGLNNAFAMTAGEKAVAYGAALGISGSIVGGVIGTLAKKKFTIGGRKERFHDLQEQLMRRLVVQ
jgi:hypothetical protein